MHQHFAICFCMRISAALYAVKIMKSQSILAKVIVKTTQANRKEISSRCVFYYGSYLLYYTSWSLICDSKTRRLRRFQTTLPVVLFSLISSYHTLEVIVLATIQAYEKKEHSTLRRHVANCFCMRIYAELYASK